MSEFQLQQQAKYILEIDIKEIGDFIENRLDEYNYQSQDQSLTTKLRENALFFYNLGVELMHEKENQYNHENLQKKRLKIKKDIQKVCSFIAKSNQNSHDWLLKMVAKQKEQVLTQDQVEFCYQTRIDPQILEEIQQNSTVKNRLFSVKATENNNYEFQGVLCNDEILTLEQQDYVISQNSTNVDFSVADTNSNSQTELEKDEDFISQSYFTFNNQQMHQEILPQNKAKFSKKMFNLVNNVISQYMFNFYAKSEDNFSIFTEPMRNHISKCPQVLDPLETIINLITMLNSIHLQNMAGIFSIYGWNLLFQDIEGLLKIPNILSLIYSENYVCDSLNMPPELFLSQNESNNYDKGDIWVLGCIFYKLVYGKNLIDSKMQGNQAKIVQEILKFKSPRYVQQKLSEQPIQDSYVLFPISQSNNEAQIDSESQNTTNNVLKDFVIDLIVQCLKFDPNQRPSSIELMLNLHNFIKENVKNIPGEGLFSQKWLGKQEMEKRMLSLRRVAFIKKENNQQDSEVNEIQNRDLDPEIYIVSGGAVLIYYHSSYVVYNSPDNQLYVLNNPLLKDKRSICAFTVPEILQNKGIEVITNGRIIQGHFQEMCSPDKIQIMNGYTESPVNLEFNPRTKLPLEDYLTYYLASQNFIPDFLHSSSTNSQFSQLNSINNLRFNQQSKQNQVQSIYQNPHKIHREHQHKLENQHNKEQKEKWNLTLSQLKQFNQIVQELSSEHQFPTLLGHWTFANFNQQSLPYASDESPIFLNDRKNIHIYKKSEAFIYNLSNFSISHYSFQSKQTNNHIQNGENMLNMSDQFYDNYLNNELKRNDQIQQECINDIQGLFKESDEEHLQTLFNQQRKTRQNVQITIYFLDGIVFEGTVNNNEQLQGTLEFNNRTSKMQILGPYKEDTEYFTRIEYSGGDFYEGCIQNTMYNGMGLYGHNKNKLFEGSFENDIFISGTIYYYDDFQTQYTGTVRLDSSQQYIKEGKGKLIFQNGDVYEGDFIQDKFHGKGLISYKNGKNGFYEGYFNNGLKEGFAISKDAHGNQYDGEFNQNKKHGRGKEILTNQDIYEGQFINGFKHGVGLYIYNKGHYISYEGEFKNDQKNGVGILLSRDGKQYSVKFYKDEIIRKKFIGFLQQNSQGIQYSDYIKNQYENEYQDTINEEVFQENYDQDQQIYQQFNDIEQNLQQESLEEQIQKEYIEKLNELENGEKFFDEKLYLNQQLKDIESNKQQNQNNKQNQNEFSQGTKRIYKFI